MSQSNPENPSNHDEKPEVDPKKVEALVELLNKWAKYGENVDYGTARAAAKQLPRINPSRASVGELYNALSDELKERQKDMYQKKS